MKRRINSRYTFKDIRGIRTLKKLSYVLGERTDYLTELAIQKDTYYKPYWDEQPGKKRRHIDQPTGELLRVQTRIRDRILDLASLCKVTYGGVQGLDTKRNAEQHLNKDTLVKLDLHDCFRSAKTRMVRRLFKNRFGYSEPVTYLLTELCTYDGHVPVGSTLSTSLVNHVLNPVWEKIDALCADSSLAFTTWVDDIAISGKSAEKKIEAVKRIINNYGFCISWSKKEIQRSNGAQTVTGNGVNTKTVTIPKKKRLEIVQSIKLDPNSPGTIGKLNFAAITNPSQATRLIKLRDKAASIK